MTSSPSTPATDSITSSSPLNRPELLAPAGDWDCAKAAIENGADAIYFGLDRFNARMRADNFTEADLPQLMTVLHQRGVKGYVTLNTLVFPDELVAAERYLRTIITAGVDAIIVQDVGICQLIRHLSPDVPIHASTQMTVTSAAGVEFAHHLGCQLVVLARECSLKDIHRIQTQLADRQISLPLEVFVHGALCVAYSGQCLTSEALGGRSANRGECAQACRMPYDLIVDGQPWDLGDRRYLLSPQDLAGLSVLPELIQAGIHSLKIEGRLKQAEYVANVTRVYRQAIDRVLHHPESPKPATAEDWYQLEMAFSRGLYSGWFRGIQNQELVHARFGKKRGVYVGDVLQVQRDRITIRRHAPIKPGDGVVFDNGHPDQPEVGGRVYAVETQRGTTSLSFSKRDFDCRKVQIGDRIWKTSDPELDRQLRQTFAGDLPKFQRPIDLELYGDVNQPLTVIGRDRLGHVAQVTSSLPLTLAHTQPLTTETLRAQFSRLGNTPFCLADLTPHLTADVMLPVSELNRMRRELVAQLEAQRRQPPRWSLHPERSVSDLLEAIESLGAIDPSLPTPAVTLIGMVRQLDQLQAALDAKLPILYCELEDPRRYRTAVEMVRHSAAPETTLWVAPPRITKPNETWILRQVLNSGADGYLIRNYDQLEFFRGQRCVGDFSLNMANPIAARYFKQFGLERLTASYDLNSQQLETLLQQCPSDWMEVTLHQHMPMFHMEHCVFCAFLSDGTDYTNCGRPCETHSVTLRDRVGTDHILQADAGCRNTVWNGKAQTGAESLQRLVNSGLRYVRIEFVNESPHQVSQTIAYYQRLLKGEISGTQLWKQLQLHSQLGVTRGAIG